MTSSQRFRFWLVGAVVFVVLLYLLRAVLLPFVAGMAIAYFLDPLADRLERAGLSRTLAASLIVGVFFALAAAILAVLAPLVHDQVLAFAHKVPDYVTALSERVDPLLRDLQRKLTARQMDQLRSSVGSYAGTAAAWGIDLIQRVLSGGLAVVSLLSLLFITPIVTLYLLRDWDHITARVDSWLPRDHAPTIRAQLRIVDRTLAGFLRGQATVCLCLAAFYGLGLTMVGLDLGLVIGIGAGLVSFVPYLGAISGFVIGVGLGFAQTLDWGLPGMVAAVFAVGNLLEGYALTPRLVGDKVGLHPVWIMFALLAGSALFGFVGLLLAVPVAAVIGVLIRFGLGHYLASPLYHGHPPASGS